MKTLRLRCNNKMHQITLTDKGRLIFHNHPQGFRKEECLVALGGTVCACQKFRDAWRTAIKIKTIPSVPHLKSFKEEIEKCIGLAKQRYDLKHKREDLLSVESERRQSLRNDCLVKNALMKVFKSCNNSFINRTTKIDLKFSSSEIAPSILWHNIASSSNNSFYMIKYNLVAAVSSIGMKWYKDIYKKGLAVIDNHLILKIFELEKEEVCVDAVPIPYGPMYANTKAVHGMDKVIYIQDGQMHLRDREHKDFRRRVAL